VELVPRPVALTVACCGSSGLEQRGGPLTTQSAKFVAIVSN
jgi:hypothetical protein